MQLSLSTLPLLIKLHDDNLAVKTISSFSAAEQPPVDSVVQNNVSVLLTKIMWPSRLTAHLLDPVKKIVQK
jgi:hypothetical protein